MDRPWWEFFPFNTLLDVSRIVSYKVVEENGLRTEKLKRNFKNCAFFLNQCKEFEFLIDQNGQSPGQAIFVHTA